MFNFFSNLFSSDNTLLKECIASGALLVDVRSPQEFAAGSIAGAVNMPLGELQKYSSELEKQKQVIAFCHSGIRSGQAVRIIKGFGVAEVINGGSMANVAKVIGK